MDTDSPLAALQTDKAQSSPGADAAPTNKTNGLSATKGNFVIFNMKNKAPLTEKQEKISLIHSLARASRQHSAARAEKRAQVLDFTHPIRVGFRTSPDEEGIETSCAITANFSLFVQNQP